MNYPAARSPSSRTGDGALYLDNAATSWPKPPGVAAAISSFLEEIGANPGRSAHRTSVQAARIIYETRQAVADLFNAPDPLRVVFGHNITDALNQALHGLLQPGDHVVTSSMEHNSVMRPLRQLEKQGLELTCVPCAPDGTLQAERVEDALRPNTRLIALNHASNVCGTFLPVREVGEIALRYGLLFLVDTAQTAGAYPIDMQDSCIDLLAFTGHKSLYGPTGTGGLVIGERVNEKNLRPIRQGGTGSRSEFEHQPDFLPDMLESGTANTAGLAGLRAGLAWLNGQGLENIRRHEEHLCALLMEGLAGIAGVSVYGTGQASRQAATVAFNLHGMPPSEAGLRLDEEFGILCRVGLHCAPAAHRTLGTFPDGSVRFGLGAFNTEEDVTDAVCAVQRLGGEIVQ